MAVMVMLTGCMPKMTIEQMKAARPQRPAELDKLNKMVGTWEVTGEARMAGLDEVLETRGTSELKWGGDGWYLIEDNVFTMKGLGEMKAHGTWAYDAKAGKFRTAWLDTMGGIGVGTVWHNEKTDVWHMRAKSHSPFGTTTGKGSHRFIDDNTIEWTWTEYAMGGLFKTMEMKGTSKRK